jgi:hypothetical protein
MGKYTTYKREKPKPPRTVHPVMRGIGCIMIILVPILAYGISVLLVNYGLGHGWPIPVGWSGPIDIHPLLWRLQGLQSSLQFLQTQNNLEANLIFTFAITIVIGGIMTILFGYLSSIFGPSRYGPTDAPPIRGVKVKRYKR